MSEDDFGGLVSSVPDQIYGDSFERLASLIGHVAMHWSDLHYSLYGLFQIVINDRAISQAIFFKPTSDTQQRAIVKAAFLAKFADRPEMTAAYNDIDKRINKLSGERNAAMHTAWMYSDTSTDLLPISGWKPHASLDTTDPAGQFRRLANDISSISVDLIVLGDEAFVALNPEPQRPAAPILPRAADLFAFDDYPQPTNNQPRTGG